MITNKELLNDPAQILKQELINEIVRQGHSNSGNLVQSLKVEITDGSIPRAIITMLDYGIIVDSGVKSSSIPFGESRGNFSAYLQGLMDSYNWDLGTAIRVAKTAKVEGSPTAGSFTLSKNGKRTGFIPEVLTNTRVLQQVTQIMLNKLVNITTK